MPSTFLMTAASACLRLPIERWGKEADHAFAKRASQPPKMEKLTDRQQQTLEEIRRHVRSYGFPPTRRELAAALSMGNWTSVNDLLEVLARKGWIELTAGTKRGIKLLADEGLPIIGSGIRIAAGRPVLAEERELERLPDWLAKRFRPRADYFLTVSGDSMDEVGLCNGDIVAIKETPEAATGQIVAATIDGEITLKKYHPKRDGRVELRPASRNPEHKPIFVELEESEFYVLGIAVGGVLSRIEDPESWGPVWRPPRPSGQPQAS